MAYLADETIWPADAVDASMPHKGGRLYGSITGGPIRAFDGTIVGAVAIVRDVTKQRHLEQVEQELRAELEARLNLLQLVLDELPGSVYLVRGPQARLVLANRATSVVWGAEWQYNQSFEDFLREHSIRLFGNDGRQLPLEQLATLRAAALGESASSHQEVIRRPDGTTLPVLVNAIPLDALSALPRLPHELTTLRPTERLALVMHQDVTALKEAEALKDEFINLATHELRTPTSILSLFVDRWITRTQRGQGAELDQWQHKALGTMKQAMHQLKQLTEDVLDATRMQTGYLHLQMNPTDLVTLIQQIVSWFPTGADGHPLSVHTVLCHLRVMADSFRISQVLTNLISNAIKYSPQGGNVEVTLTDDIQAHEALISVRDHGMGIPHEQQASIFGRATNVRDAGISGTGLGLYLCRDLIERHEGHIWFESAEGVGSTFFLTLPLMNPAD